jgi:hypothetical protein
MAERLEDATLPPRKGKVKRSRERYPYGEWFDGAVWRLRKGEDFTVSPQSIRTGIHSAARRRGIKVATRIYGDTVMVQRKQETEPQVTTNSTDDTAVRPRWGFWGRRQ